MEEHVKVRCNGGLSECMHVALTEGIQPPYAFSHTVLISMCQSHDRLWPFFL